MVLKCIESIFVDSVWVDRWPNSTDRISANHDLEDPYLTATSHMSLMMMNRHLGYGNIAFVDGHIDSIKLERFWSLKWSKDFEIQLEDMTREGGSPIYQK